MIYIIVDIQILDLIELVYIKCKKCGIIFNYNNINKKYCNRCAQKIKKENNKKASNKKYNNDNNYRKRKKEKTREKFIYDNYYGLILGTSSISKHRKNNFNKEAEIVRREKNRQLKGKTYTHPKYQDLQDKKNFPVSKNKVRKGGTKKKKFKSVKVPEDINNFDYVDEICNYIIDKFKIKIKNYNKQILGCKKVKTGSFNTYIMYRKFQNRVVADRIEILQRCDMFEKSNRKSRSTNTNGNSTK